MPVYETWGLTGEVLPQEDVEAIRDQVMPIEKLIEAYFDGSEYGEIILARLYLEVKRQRDKVELRTALSENDATELAVEQRWGLDLAEPEGVNLFSPEILKFLSKLKAEGSEETKRKALNLLRGIVIPWLEGESEQNFKHYLIGRNETAAGIITVEEVRNRVQQIGDLKLTEQWTKMNNQKKIDGGNWGYNDIIALARSASTLESRHEIAKLVEEVYDATNLAGLEVYIKYAELMNSLEQYGFTLSDLYEIIQFDVEHLEHYEDYAKEDYAVFVSSMQKAIGIDFADPETMRAYPAISPFDIMWLYQKHYKVPEIEESVKLEAETLANLAPSELVQKMRDALGSSEGYNGQLYGYVLQRAVEKREGRKQKIDYLIRLALEILGYDSTEISQEGETYFVAGKKLVIDTRVGGDQKTFTMSAGNFVVRSGNASQMKVCLFFPPRESDLSGATIYTYLQELIHEFGHVKEAFGYEKVFGKNDDKLTGYPFETTNGQREAGSILYEYLLAFLFGRDRGQEPLVNFMALLHNASTLARYKVFQVVYDYVRNRQVIGEIDQMTKEDLLEKVLETTEAEFAKVWSGEIKLNRKLAMMYLVLLTGRYGLTRDSRYMDAEKQWIIPIRKYLAGDSDQRHLLDAKIMSQLEVLLSNFAATPTPEAAISKMSQAA